MRRLLFILLIVTQNFSYAQSYEETVDKCTQAFQSGFDPNNLAELESKLEEQMDQLKKCVVGLKFPPFKATTIDNTTFTLDDLKGKVVLVNLWFIGCAPCVAEMPMFNELQNEFSTKDFMILSFGLDDTKSIEEFIQKRSLNFRVFPNSKDLIANKFKLAFGYPTNIFLDQDGQIIHFKTGGAIDEVGLKRTKEEFRNLIKKELNK